MTTSRSRTPLGLFIVGSNTEVGKTWTTCAIARSLVAAGARVGVYKPAASGAEWRDGTWVASDAERLWEAAGRPLTLAEVCPQVFSAPLAPHLAARAEGKELDAERLRTGIGCWWTADWDVVLVEGAGGLLSPISDRDLVADIALDLGLPLLLVVPNSLGVISQTLQTALAAVAYQQDLHELFPGADSSASPRRVPGGSPQNRRNLQLRGIVLNQPGPPAMGDISLASNREELEKHCPVPVLGELSHGASEFTPAIDWWAWIQEVSAMSDRG